MSVSRSLLRGTPGSSRLLRAALGQPHLAARTAAGRRWIQISTLEGSTQPDNLPINASSADAEGPDAKFEVLGAPYSLLSASLSASQTLYTRRGTLVGLSGKAENVISTLATLEPFRRVLLGIPFFYQKVTSASPVTVLMGTRSPLTSFTVVHLDGTIDWMVSQREALLAWTGQTLRVTPTVNTQLTFGYWGNSRITGRGLVGLVGHGQIYELVLGSGESYVAHPSHVLAYTMGSVAPEAFRFRASSLRLEVPGASWATRTFGEARFVREVQRSEAWRWLAAAARWARTMVRRTLFGDALFLRFHGPATVLLQTRAARVADVLSAKQINEVADTPPGAVEDAVRRDVRAEAKAIEAATLPPKAPSATPAPTLSTASVAGDGSVRFDQAGTGAARS